MEETDDWDIEECRTKFESDEHWALKRDFLLAHKDNFPKDRIICLAQVFVNIELLRCKYPDSVMRQVGLLAKGIGKDYKTRQKELLQRTFVKASDAASAKVKGSKRLPPTSQDPPSKKICFVKESSKDSSTNNTFNQNSSDTKSCIKFIKETRESMTDSPNSSIESSSVQPNKYIKALKKEGQIEKIPVYSPKIATIKSSTNTPNFQKKTSEPSLDFNSQDPYTANLFLVFRSFLSFSSFYDFLKCSVEFSHYKLTENFSVGNKLRSVCTLTVQIKSQTLTLGTGRGISKKASKEEASMRAMKLLLQRCYTIEITKRVAGNEEIDLDKLIGLPEKEEKISNDNIGAKMLKLMGWSGGALGRTGEGIVEPVKASNVIGRQGLGISDEQRPTHHFQNRVKAVLDSMLVSLREQPDGVVPDVIFSSELSSEQRKHIHLLVRKNIKYYQLKSVSYGKNQNRFLVIKPKMDSKSLFEKVSSQGGLTDKYGIHKPGTLSLEDISKKLT